MKELIEEKKFEMRAYDKVEPLMQALGGIGYNVRRHRFLRQEVEQIVRHLGEP